MSRARELAADAFDRLLGDARAEGIPTDVIGRALLARVVEGWLAERPWRDVANELAFVAESLDPETEFHFMRP
ncbi:MAG: hypothetical protein R3F35_05665 [Myxococcota bacterium]